MPEPDVRCDNYLGNCPHGTLADSGLNLCRYDGRREFIFLGAGPCPKKVEELAVQEPSRYQQRGIGEDDIEPVEAISHRRNSTPRDIEDLMRTR